MSNFLKEFNEQLEGVSEVKNEVTQKLEWYKEARDSKKRITVTFDIADPDGNLSGMDEQGINVVLRADVLKNDKEYYQSAIRNKFLLKEMYVFVSEIDFTNKTVYVTGNDKDKVVFSEAENEYVFVAGKEKKEQTEEQKAAYINKCLTKEIKDAIDRKESPNAWGRVISVTDNYVRVNLFDRNIMGICYVTDWAPGYVRFLKERAHVGDIFHFEVRDYDTKGYTKDNGKKGVFYVFYLTRLNLVSNPWEKLDLNVVKEGSMLSVKCVAIEDPTFTKKQFFWGICKSLPEGIEVCCYHNSKLQIEKGFTYNCIIKKFNKETKILTAMPVQYSRNTAEAIEKAKKPAGKTDNDAALEQLIKHIADEK